MAALATGDVSAPIACRLTSDREVFQLPRAARARALDERCKLCSSFKIPGTWRTGTVVSPSGQVTNTVAIPAADYSAVASLLAAVKAPGADDSDKMLAQMCDTKVNDMYAKGGWIRPDGAMVHDMHLMQVKTPAASKEPWYYHDVVEGAWTTKAESRCPLWSERWMTSASSGTP